VSAHWEWVTSIAGAGMGRDMALYGADVLNIWRPRDSEIEAFAWDVQGGHAFNDTR
jgi:hypothetical protein